MGGGQPPEWREGTTVSLGAFLFCSLSQPFGRSQIAERHKPPPALPGKFDNTQCWAASGAQRAPGRAPGRRPGAASAATRTDGGREEAMGGAAAKARPLRPALWPSPAAPAPNNGGLTLCVRRGRWLWLRGCLARRGKRSRGSRSRRDAGALPLPPPVPALPPSPRPPWWVREHPPARMRGRGWGGGHALARARAWGAGDKATCALRLSAAPGSPRAAARARLAPRPPSRERQLAYRDVMGGRAGRPGAGAGWREARARLRALTTARNLTVPL